MTGQIEFDFGDSRPPPCASSTASINARPPVLPSAEANAWYEAMDAEYFRDTGVHLWEFNSPPQKPSDQEIAESHEGYLSYIRLRNPFRFLHTKLEVSEVPSPSFTSRSFRDLFIYAPSLYKGRHVLLKGKPGVYHLIGWSHVSMLDGVGVTTIYSDLTGGRDWWGGDGIPDGLMCYLCDARLGPDQYTYVAKYGEVQRIVFRRCSVSITVAAIKEDA